MGHCTFHPSNAVDGICLRCNSGICSDCICEFRGRPYCTRCVLSVKQQHGILQQTLIWVGLFVLFGGILSGWALWGLSQLPETPTSQAKDAGSPDAGDAGLPGDGSFALPARRQANAPPPLSPEQKKKLEEHRKGCEQDKGKDCLQFAHLVLRSPEPLRYQLAVRALQQACRVKHGRSCAELGQMYSMGVGVPRSMRLATQLFDRSCEYGNALGCNNLGALLIGDGKKKSLAPKAAAAFRKSCKLGYLVACRNLGTLLVKTIGTKRAMAEARKIFLRACKRKNAISCMQLGLMYQKGMGGRANKRQAKRYIKQACKLGLQEACN